MSEVSILDDDKLARLLLKPKDQISIIDNEHQLIKITSKNFQFNSHSGNTESVNCLRLFGDAAINKCHEEGIKKTKNNNQRRLREAIEKKRKPNLQSYIGYASSLCYEVINSSDEYINFSVKHLKEHDNFAHCNIHLEIRQALQNKTKKQKTKFKNAAISKLSDKFQQFTKYIL